MTTKVEEETVKEETNGNSPPQIYGLMAKILSEVESIAKSRRNEQQNYKFRGIDEVYDAIHPVFAAHGVFTVPRVLSTESFDRETKTGGILRFVEMRVAYDFFAPDGSSVTAEAVGEAMDSGDKASNKAMSAAHKYTILQTFCIPTGDTPDADATTHDDLKPAQACPECGKSNAVIKGKEEYGGGWLCFKKRGGCGFTWQDKPKSSDEPTAEVAALREAIKKAMAALNEAGDDPPWDIPRVNKMVRDSFNGKRTVDLSVHELGDLAQMFSQRLEDLRVRGSIILSIKASETPEGIAAYLQKHHGSTDRLEDLPIDWLRAMEKAVGIPF